MADDSGNDVSEVGRSVATQQQSHNPHLGTQEFVHQLTHAIQSQQEWMEQLRLSMEPVLGFAQLMAQTLQPYYEAAERWRASIEEPLRGVLEQFNRSLRPLFDSGWLEAIQKGFKRLEDALGNAEKIGAAGWTIPLNADLDECISLLLEATNSEAADKAFVDFYSKNNAAHLAELFTDLHQQPKLTEFHGVLEEVAFALAAQKYRLAVPALLAAFEGVARRCWDDSAWAKRGRDTFFNSKLQSLEKGSYDHVTWSATRAFVEALYSPNRDKDPKPQLLNRHWVLHGRGSADGNLADCLRLLQAIHTVVTLADDDLNSP